MSSQDLVATYVDCLREQGGRRDERSVARMSRTLKGLLEEGVAEDVISEAIVRMVSRGLTDPSRLGGFVNDVLLARHRKPDSELLEAFLASHGGEWPTGIRFVRGTHGGTYRIDPLGYDRGHADGISARRPTREELLRALRGERG